jgi:hypothetical protein
LLFGKLARMVVNHGLKGMVSLVEEEFLVGDE